ncbi:MAG: type II toxin-antitoxin system HicA family toxin [Candidatus Sungbacteria bacterium]|nr:type II toxin-antitoxin system HicA family toxin [Candidatus Sungbacteria bacterium]
MKSAQVIAALMKAGFRIIRQSGSHVRLQHPTDPTRQATVPQHSAPLPLWLIHAVLRQAKISIIEFRKLLKKK